ncbi:N-acetylmuramoyl-L-alanine amidase family protein [Candidatus Pseudothioglobus sp. Uisw_050_01]|uniref:N-acetylmuramoyl-L-alanine amidase family protein n=1 Tax=Candidatus Pseudothioglobus sp. Uisw_050_01 TaxID=3230997 RepID=UPI003A8A1B4B
MRYWISLIIAVFATSSFSEDKTTLYDFRYWTAPDQTRIVIDKEQDTLFNITNTDKVVIISFDDAEVLSKTFSNIFFKDDRIQKVLIKRDKKTIKLIVHINKKFRVKHFTLKPNTKYKFHRLVVDIIDLESQIKTQDIKVTKAVKNVKKLAQISQKIILVDAGHGGEDSGAIGKNKSQEKSVNLAIAKKLVAIINKNSNLKAVLTRSGDYYIPLTKRITIAQKENATMFISIHADSVESTTAKGASIYTLSEKGNNSKLAQQLEQSQNLVDQFGGVETVIDNDQFLKNILTDFSRKDRDMQSFNLAKEIISELEKIGPIHKKIPQKANFVVLKSPAIPSVLVETAFISNPTQEKRLTNNKQQHKIAASIYQGILNYYQKLE